MHKFHMLAGALIGFFASVQPLAAEPVVVCIGDSITYGVHLEPEESYPYQLGMLLPEATIINSGVSGNTSQDGLNRWNSAVEAHQPDYVAIMFGTNDSVLTDYGTYRVPVAQYESNLRTMVTRSRRIGAEPILCTLLPINPDPYFDRHPQAYYDAEGGLETILQNYRDAAKTVSDDMNVALVDTYAMVEKDMTLLRDPPDGVHYNPDGCHVHAALVNQQLAPMVGAPVGELELRQSGSGMPATLWQTTANGSQPILASTQVSANSARLGTFGGDLYLASREGGIWKADGQTVVEAPGAVGRDAPLEFTVYQDAVYQVTASVAEDGWLWNIEVAPDAFQQTTLTTADGNGGDSFVHWYSNDAAPADTNWGGRDYLEIKNAGTDPSLYRKGYFRFDLGELDGEQIAAATFAMTAVGTAGSTDQTFVLYGLHDGDPGENWSEGTGVNLNVAVDSDPANDAWLTWNNAPANQPGNELDPSRVTRLGTFTGAAAGETATMDADALAEFLNADTDGLVTLILARETHDPNFYGTAHQFACKEAGLDMAPTLSLLTIAAPLPGDLNGDGFVGGDDLDVVRSHWGEAVTAGDLASGDPSGDGFVGGDDLDFVRSHWGEGAAPTPAFVPEPATMAMLLSLALAGGILLAAKPL